MFSPLFVKPVQVPRETKSQQNGVKSREKVRLGSWRTEYCGQVTGSDRILQRDRILQMERVLQANRKPDTADRQDT